MDKKFIIALVVLIVLASLILILKFKEPTAHQFGGAIIEMGDNFMSISGFYLENELPVGPDLQNPKEVKVLIIPETKFTKTVWYMPSQEELQRTGGVWRPADLRKEQKAGSFQELFRRKVEQEEGITIIVQSQDNIFNKRKFKASEVRYIEQIYP